MNCDCLNDKHENIICEETYQEWNHNKIFNYEFDLDCCLADVAFVSGDPFSNDLGVNDDDDRRHQHETLEIEPIHNYVSIEHMNYSDTHVLPRAEPHLEEAKDSSTGGVSLQRIDQARDPHQAAPTLQDRVNTAATEQTDAKLCKQAPGRKGEAGEEDKGTAEESKNKTKKKLNEKEMKNIYDKLEKRFKYWIEDQRDSIIPNVISDKMLNILKLNALEVIFDIDRNKDGKLQYDSTFISIARYCKRITLYMIQTFYTEKK